MQRTISILLAILMLASSTGVTYAKHFCGEHEVISIITLGEKQLSCGMISEADDCNDEIQEDIKCCKNKYENVDTDDNFAKASFNSHLSVPFITSFVTVFVLQQTDFNQQLLPVYSEYDPPTIDEDIPILYQVFII